MRTHRPTLAARMALSSLAAAGVLAVGPAQAKDFSVLYGAADSYTIIDNQAIERLPGNVVRRTWTVGVQRSIVSGDRPVPGYVRTQVDYDCLARQSRWLKFSAFSRSGELLLQRDNPIPLWTSPTTTTVLKELAVVCEGRSGDTSISADGIARVVIALMSTWDPVTPTAKAPPGKAAAPPAKAPPAKMPYARVQQPELAPAPKTTPAYKKP